MAENGPEYTITLTNEERIRMMVNLLTERGIRVKMATAKRLNVEGMQELIKCVNSHLRMGE